ncbi:MAG: hypothetical protein AAB465_03110 [Patescibacteria group bacterium]
MKKYLFATLLTAILGVAIVVPTIALAQTNNWEMGLTQFQGQTGLGNQDLPTTIGKIVNIVLSFLGLIAVVIIIIGGFMWMTSGGSEEKIGAAKKLMINGIIGLLIIIISYAAANFIVSRLKTVAS